MSTRRDNGSGRPPLARAFGLDLELGFPVPGLEPRAQRAGGRPATVLELAAARALDREWAEGETTRISEWRCPDGRLDAALERSQGGAYRLYTREFGRYHVDPDGGRIRCAPPRVARWRWQRCLIGHVLPLAAVLRGLEVFHASAVALEGRAVAIVGGSRAGKTSVAVNLVLRGSAHLLTDDVLVLDPAAKACTVHPGPGVLSLRHAEARALGARRVRELGHALGDDGEALRVRVERDDRVYPLGAIYFLDVAEEAPTTIKPLQTPDPRLLLASSFNFYVRTPERLEAQLGVCARLAAEVPMFWVEVHRESGAAALSREIESHATSAVAA